MMFDPTSWALPERTRAWAESGPTQGLLREVREEEARCLERLMGVAKRSTDPEVRDAAARFEILFSLRESITAARSVKDADGNQRK